MSGYRCVNYYDLCRLCTNSNHTNVNIFSEEGKKLKLYHKIIECLPVDVDEKDKLPKIICSKCLKHVEIIAEFRKTCINAQNMLESCLKTPKLRNGGKVYIKDDIPKLVQGSPTTVVQQTFQQPPPLTASNQQTIITNNNDIQTQTQTTATDFLGSIMQAVGIQNAEDEIPLQQPQQQQQQVQHFIQQPQQPQYTLTLDGQALKSNHIHYKIEEPSYTLTELTEDIETQSALVQSVDEFLKLNKTTLLRKDVQTNTNTKTETVKEKKSNINLVIRSKTKPNVKTIKQLHQQQQSPVQTTAAVGTTILQQQPPQQQQHHQFVVPIKFKDATGEHQILTSIDPKNYLPTTTYLQMKLPPQFTVDSQQVVHLTGGMPSISLAPAHLQTTQQQQFTQLTTTPSTPTITTAQTTTNNNLTPITNFRITNMTPHRNQIQQPTGIQLTTIPTLNNVINKQIITTASGGVTTTGTTTATCNATKNNMHIQTIKKKPTLVKLTIPATITPSQVPKQQQYHQQQLPQNTTITIKQDSSINNNISTKSKTVKAATKTAIESSKITTTTAPTSDAPIATGTTGTKIECTSTTCDACGKTFKRKEHLVQHIKLHLGLRPFKCTEVGCNKAFSRKEHLMRHIVSHTGKKMFSCDLCQKLFSRKDNLNKHRRTHPESSTNYNCDLCSKVFAVKAYFIEHKAMHELDDLKPTFEIKNQTTKKQKKNYKTDRKTKIIKINLPTAGRSENGRGTNMNAIELQGEKQDVEKIEEEEEDEDEDYCKEGGEPASLNNKGIIYYNTTV